MKKITIPSPSWKIIFFGWLFILVIPIVSLLILVEGIIENEESDLLSSGKNELVRKMREETGKLRPENRLKSEFLELEKKLEFPIALRGRKHSFEKGAPSLRGPAGSVSGTPPLGVPPASVSGTHSPFLPEKMLPFIQNQIQREMGLTPLAIVTTGEDCKKIEYFLDPRFFPAGENQTNKTLHFLIMWASGMLDRKAWIDENFVAEQKRKFLEQTPSLSASARMKRLALNLLGSNYFDFLTRGTPRSTFSYKFGSGKIWIYCQFVSASSAPDSPILGGFMVFFRNRDLKPAFLLKPALNRFDWGITNRVQVYVPKFQRTKKSLIFLTPVTRHCLRLLRKGNKAVLFSRLDGQALVHPLSKIFDAVKPCIFFGLIIVLGLLFRLFLCGSGLPLSIRQKLELAIGISVVVPLLALGVIIFSFNRFSLHLEGLEALNLLREKFEILEGSLNNNFVQQNQEIFNFSSKLNSILQTNEKDVREVLGKLVGKNYCSMVHLIRADGMEWFDESSYMEAHPIEASALKKLQEVSRVISLRIFRELEGFSEEFLAMNPRKEKSAWSKRRFAVSKVLEFGDVKPFLEREMGILDPKYSGMKGSKVVLILLFGTGSEGNRLKGMLFITRRTNDIASRFFRELERTKDSFIETGNKFELRTAIFELGEEGSGETLSNRSWPEEAIIDPDIVELATRGLDNRQGGVFKTSINKDSTQAASKVFNDYPFVLVGQIKSRTPGGGTLRIYSIAATLAVYSFLIVGILVKYLSGIFIRPIEVLTYGSRSISSGDYDVFLDLPDKGEFFALAKDFNAMAKGLRERSRLKRFVSSNLISEIVADVGSDLKPGGELKNCAVLFSHIVNFSRIRKEYPPDEVFGLLNAYFSVAEKTIREFGGEVDKCVEEGIMAVFHAKELDYSSRACKAALKFLNCLERQSLQVGIGIASGEVISGRIGSRIRRLDYTVIGNTVNLAARLESESRKRGNSKILVDQETAILCGKTIRGEPLSFQSIGEIEMKGFTKAIRIFELSRAMIS